MSSRNEILHLVNQYGFTIDGGDLDGFAGLFAHGEWGVEGATLFSGKAELLEVLDNVIIYADGTPRTKHVTSNVELEIDEAAGTASGQCYVTLFQQVDQLPLQAIYCGHYFDEFERVDGQWRFSRRVIRHQLVGDLSAHLKTASEIVPE
jgi:hypothetical protein